MDFGGISMWRHWYRAQDIVVRIEDGVKQAFQRRKTDARGEATASSVRKTRQKWHIFWVTGLGGDDLTFPACAAS